MKKLISGGWWLAIALCAEAGTFPYTESLTERYALGKTDLSPFDAPKTATGSKMQSNEHVVVVETEVAYFSVARENSWAQGVAAISPVQAALSMKQEGTAPIWMGCTGGDTWVPLTGKTAEEGEWGTKIEVDYSVLPHLVRYSVKAQGESAYTILKNNNLEWLPLCGLDAKVGDVGLYGDGMVNGLTGRCGTRPIEARVATSESYGMNYENLKVDASMSEAWGVENLTVVLKDANGQQIASKSATVAGERFVADFSDVAVPGGTYSYNVVLSGIGQEVDAKVGKDVELFSNVDWFGFLDGALVKATKDANLDVISGELIQKTGADAEGNVFPATHASDGALVTTVTRLTVNGVYKWAELSATASTSQFALAPCRLDNGDNPPVVGERAWAYRVGSGAWTAVEVAGVPTANGSYDVKVVFDYVAKKGNCWIKLSTEGDAAYRKIVTDFALTDTKVNNAAIIGGGISALNAFFKTTAPAEVLPTGNTIVIDKNAEVRLENLTAGTAYAVQGASGKAHLRWKDAKGGDAKWAKVENEQLKAVAGVPANGLESFDSYALGLDPTKELAKPAAVVKPGGLQSAAGVTVYVPNVVKENLPDAGVEVLFQRQKSVDGGKNWTDDGDPAKVGGELTIPFTQGTLYRVNTVLR